MDTTPPNTTIIGGPTGPTSDATPTFTFTSTEGSSTFQCKVDSGSFGPCSSPHTTTSLADGPHTFEVKATDPAGNPDASAASQAFTVDTDPPQTTIASGPSAFIEVNNATFTFASDEAGSAFECRLDAAMFAACASPKTHAGLAPGAHTFEVRSIDTAGNVDASPATATWTVQLIDPRCVNPGVICGTSGPDNLVGTSANDLILGGGGNDVCNGAGGNDVINCGAGNDIILGGSGNDVLSGTSGRDTIRGGPGRDRIFGGAGRDRLFGNGGRDRLFGQGGRDRLNGGAGRDRCSGGAGLDRLLSCEA